MCFSSPKIPDPPSPPAPPEPGVDRVDEDSERRKRRRKRRRKGINQLLVPLRTPKPGTSGRGRPPGSGKPGGYGGV